MTLKDWLEVTQYRITEGSDYGWDCYGNMAHSLDCWSGEVEGYGMSIIFDRENQEVFEVTVCDYSEEEPAAYRFINPNYREAYDKESKSRGNIDEAWEGVKWVDLELFEDWVSKAVAIRDGVPYDKRVMVPLTLEKDELLLLATLAHEADMTLNQYVEKILREEIARLSSETVVG